MRNIWNIQIGEVIEEDKSLGKALEKRSIKEWAYAIHDKDPRSSQELSLRTPHGETPPWNAGDPKPVHIRAGKASAQPFRKMVYQAHLSKSSVDTF